MKKLLGFLLIAAVALGGWWAWRMWNDIFNSATAFSGENKVLLIPAGADIDQVADSLRAGAIVKDIAVFRWVAQRKEYPQRIKPGRYVVPNGMSMNELVNKLRLGEQDPVKVTFHNVKTIPQLAGKLARNIQADSLELLAVLGDPATARRLGFTEQTFIGMFLPDTYEVWWTTSPSDLVDRFATEYKRFWTDARKAKAAGMGLSQSEVSTLASIVQAETDMLTDAPLIASVYLNRLRIGMPLQADPTLKYALGLDSVNRVLHQDKRVDSPYNTYTHKGLPPGPINLPDPRYIDAVLNPAQSNYLYFCAREDLSGYSNFSTTYQQHLVHARRYQKALDQRGILR